MARYRRVRARGVTFLFKVEDDGAGMLHIYVRHLTEVDDALDVWFDLSATEVWNAEHARYERFGSTCGLYWFWLDQPGKVVLVITCFRR